MRPWKRRLAFLAVPALLLSLRSCPERSPVVVFHRRILPRGAWRPVREPDYERLRPMDRPTRITVHHSGIAARHDSWAATCGLIRDIQAYHVDQKGWADIGYHFVVDRIGRIWEARPLAYQGAHAGNAELNRGNVGIVVLGNFELRRPTAGEEEGLAWLVGQLSQRYGIGAGRILCHGDLKPTLCPGRYLKPLVRRLSSGGDHGPR